LKAENFEDLKPKITFPCILFSSINPEIGKAYYSKPEIIRFFLKDFDEKNSYFILLKQ
jgi:hypothetical protein